ncbi:UbiA family prenyltransferase [Streptomyces sp. NPDC048527]|uniref:UbiA family prenyltransferase n=1 Tax=Streptomyces sp. NPDC048527 TaxID=3365568 RepID=UPI0037199C5C
MSTRTGAAIRAHLETWRPYTLAYPGLVGLAGVAADAGVPAAAGGGHTALEVLAAWLCPTLGWLGGHYLGDYFDRDLDAIGKPQRPIPSGRLSPGTARACGLGAVLAAALVALAVNWPVVVGVVLASAGIVAYSRLLKGRGILGNAVRGLLTALAVVFGAAVAAPPRQLPSWHVLPVAFAFLLHDTASNLVGTLRDVDADREGGYRTVPVVRGLDAATRIAAVLYAASVAAVIPYALTAAHPVTGAILVVAAVVAGAWAYLSLLRTPRPGPRLALRSHAVLVGERLVLAAAVIASDWGALPALLLLLPVLTASLLIQRRMRTRHEFPPEAQDSAVVVSPACGDAAPVPAPRM